MNEYDSERIMYLLENMGHIQTMEMEEADIVVINTCSVREKAENRLFGHLGSFKSIKDKRDILLCVGGCTAQSLSSRIQEKYPFVDIVFGTHNISQLPSLIQERTYSGMNICSVFQEGPDHDLEKVKRSDVFRAYVPISVGCNNYCSYCIVPYVRGRERSAHPEKIIEAVKRLVDGGVLEVTLLGQNVNSYGKDIEGHVSFPSLLEKVSDIKGLKRIRFMTSHPKDFSRSLIEVITDRSNLMNHIHLPLQAGSNKILRAMNRMYTREKYLDTIRNIREKIRGCSITTDIIVGFPGEREDDFRHTLDAVKMIRFDRAFTFIYSKRRGTAAAGLKDPVPIEEKKKWFQQLLDVQNRISFERNQGFLGKNYKVLVEGRSPKDSRLLQGRMENNTVVLFSGKNDIIGKIVDVHIREAKTFYVRGERTD